MMPLRVAMPNSVTKPTSEAMLITPLPRNTARTPPIRASGRLTMINSALRSEPNAISSSTRMPTTTAPPSTAIVRDAACSLSNCPP
jgi:hypothetical protein